MNPVPKTQPTSRVSVDDSFQAKEQKLLDMVLALFEPEKPPASWSRAATPQKSATPQLLESIVALTESYSTLTPKTKAEIEKYIRLKKVGNTIQVEYPISDSGV
jgi:hypothetical protein